MTTRSRWINWMQHIARPVVAAMAEDRLTERLPATPNRPDRAAFAPSEAICRTLVGIAPWLELRDVPEDEREQHAWFRATTAKAIAVGVDPAAKDRLPFDKQGQPLVEAAFLCHALLRAPSLWEALEAQTQQRLIALLIASRITTPGRSNWLLFAAMVETLLAKVGTPHLQAPIDDAIDSHEKWYKGDGVYGDGPWLHNDYYNSFVIQPMLIDILDAWAAMSGNPHPLTERIAQRFTRYAAVQERLISPEGTYPPVGRSLAYRFGAFQHLAQAALQHRLPPPPPPEVTPAQVRCALTAVIERSLNASETFIDDTWLNVGLAGHQPSLGERYISRGSVYLCCAAFLPLGLPISDPFWSEPDAAWTAKRIWDGQDLPADHAIKDD